MNHWKCGDEGWEKQKEKFAQLINLKRIPTCKSERWLKNCAGNPRHFFDGLFLISTNY